MSELVEIKIRPGMPVDGCQECSKLWLQAGEFYQLWYSQQNDPGAAGLFEAAQEAFLAHYQTHQRLEEEQ